MVLHGKKLKGLFAFVRFKKAGENAWLIIKDKDEFEGKEIKDETSVRSGRTIEEVLEGKNAMDLSDVSKKWKSHTVEPMLAKLVDEPFDDDHFIFEVKWDGYRAISETGKKTKLYSRNNQDFSKDYELIFNELKKIKKEMVIDGEIVVLDYKGRSDFDALQEYKKNKEGELVFYVFDILSFEGKDLRDLSVVQRKRILENVLPTNNLIRYSDHIKEKGKDFFKLANMEKLEGMIAKKIDSKYEEGKRSGSWQKIKLVKTEEVIICGYTKPEGKRDAFGSLVLGVYRDGELVYVGNTGSGFTDKNLKEVKAKLDKYKTKKSPFKDEPSLNNLETWLKPEVIAEVKISGWTKKGNMRHAIFMGFIKDKKAEDIEGYKPEVEHDGYEKKGNKLELSNLNKVYWPKEKYTKGDMIKYYEEISKIMIPYLKDRPQNMNRFPNGITGKSFYQKDIDSVPKFVDVETIHSESNNRDIDYIVCNNKETLLYMANLGSIEINPWNSRVGSLDKPDYLIFDLDAKEKYFEKIIKTALELRKLLEKYEIDNFVKTSGKRGIHINIPLNAKYDFDQDRTFAEIISRKIEERIPDIVSLERNPDKRKDKVYIDYLQNRRGQTTVGVYSVRPVDGAPVSTPLKWKEVTKRLDPKKFNIKTMSKRIDKVGDMWEGVLGKGIDLGKILKKLK